MTESKCTQKEYVDDVLSWKRFPVDGEPAEHQSVEFYRISGWWGDCAGYSKGLFCLEEDDPVVLWRLS